MTTRPPVSGEPPNDYPRYTTCPGCNTCRWSVGHAPVSGEPSTEATNRLRQWFIDKGHPGPLAVFEKALQEAASAECEAWLSEGYHRSEARATPPPLDVERLRRAIDNFITSQTGFDVDDAEAIAAEYARLTSKEEQP